MHFLFKQSICLDKKDYSRGVHELSGKLIESIVFKKFLEIGWIVAQPFETLPVKESLLEKNQKLSEKFEAKPSEEPAPSEEESPKKSKKQK